MNKIVKVLIGDYLVSKSDEDLELFVVNIAPDFKLNKKSKEQLKSMIAKYEADKTTTRLSIILNFLGGEVSKPSKRNANKTNSKEEEITRLIKSGAAKEVQDLQTEYDDIIEIIKNSKGDPSVVTSMQSSLKSIDQRMNLAIRKREIEMKQNIDPDAQEKYEKREIQKAFGDVEKEGSLAHQIVNGKAYEFKIKCDVNPSVLIKQLFRFYGKEPYEYSAGLINGQNNTWQIRKGTVDNWNQGSTDLAGAANG